jgi:serine/threonine-protein kinase RsbW
VIRRFPAEPAVLGHIRQFVRSEATQATLGPDGAEELTLAVSEACANVMRHTETDEIRLAYEADDTCMTVEVADEGVFRDRLPVPEVEPGGRGILLMTAFVDEVAIREGTPSRPGTVVRLVKGKPGGTLDGRP